MTILQFRESLSDRQAADAVRARIDWKYLLVLDLTDCGFDFSVLSEFRSRLLEGSAPARLLNRLLTCCQAQGLLKARGRQCADSTHVLTDGIEQALADKSLAPGELFVDSAYVSAELLVKSREVYGIALRSPTRPNLSRQKRTAGAYGLEHFAIDWERRQVRCPQGKTSVTWSTSNATGRPLIQARFSRRDCGVCASRQLCTRAKPPNARMIHFSPQPAL